MSSSSGSVDLGGIIHTQGGTERDNDAVVQLQLEADRLSKSITANGYDYIADGDDETAGGDYGTEDKMYSPPSQSQHENNKTTFAGSIYFSERDR